MAVVGLLAVVCTQGSSGPGPTGPGPGSALEPTASGGRRPLILPPAQEVVTVAAGLRNASSEPLEITKLRPTTARGVPAVVQVVRIALADRASLDVGDGLFVTFPPVALRGGECRRAHVAPARGSSLRPGDDPVILVWLRAIAAGRASLPAVTVSYEQDGDLFEQTVRFDRVVVNVRADVTAREPSADERTCASEVQLLPGAVHI